MPLGIDFHKVGSWLVTIGLKIVLIFILTFVLLRLSQSIAGRILAAFRKRERDEESIKRIDTLNNVFRFALNIVIVVIAAIMILEELGIKIGPILAAAGIVGVAVGFGAQSLIRDIISGFFIFLEDQIRVGDCVDVAGKSGIVEHMNLRMTVLRDLTGDVHFIPNGQISVVSNMTRGFSRYVFDIGVAYRENVDDVTRIMTEVDRTMRGDPEFRDDILSPLEIMGLEKFTDTAVIVRARATTRPMQQWRVAREFNRRLKIAFEKHGIAIPFPHLIYSLGKEGAGPGRSRRSSAKKNKKSAR